jgi:tetratricopeptide (TPR) repeat protein
MKNVCSLLFALAMTAATAQMGWAAGGADEEGNDSLRITDSNSLLGSYAAGRLARSVRDNDTAAEYYHRALDKDPGNRAILEEAFQLEVASGHWDEARRLALILHKHNYNNRIARFFLGVDAFRRKEYKSARRHFTAAGKGPVAELTSLLAQSWTNMAEGRERVAFSQFKKLGKAEWLAHFERLHRSMLSDLAGKSARAQRNYAAAYRKTPNNARIAEAYARHAAHWGDQALAEKLLAPFMSHTSPNPLLKSLSDEIRRGERPKFIVNTPAEGLAEVFYGIGEALAIDGGADAGQIYLQLALFANPDFVTARHALAELYDQLRLYDQALQAYSQIPVESPLWLNAQIRKALDLNVLKRNDEAKALLKSLIEKDGGDVRTLYAMGNILRAAKEYGEAVGYYDRIISLISAPEKRDWTYFYARGVCYERLKSWSLAEADLKKALDLDANQDSVLNYLGYSWVDQNQNLAEAMELIRKAVQLKPNDGYFVDSLGWAFYRQKDYVQAVKYLERAVELRPDDPVINDHLGDAYWRVDRKLEAQYQWTQSLSLKPEPEDAARTRGKLQSGLPTETTTRADLGGGVSKAAGNHSGN